MLGEGRNNKQNLINKPTNKQKTMVSKTMITVREINREE